MVALSVGNRERVDVLADIALGNDGSAYNEPMDHGWMYQRSFADPDGHQWEIIFMEMTTMPPA